MLITNLKGGLGNQMFQYATGLALAQKNNVKLFLDTSGYSDKRVINSDTPRTFDLDYFNITAEIATVEQIKTIKYPLSLLSKIWRFIDKKIIKNYHTDYEPQLLEEVSQKLSQNKNIYLDGFFQSEKNFAKIRQQLLQEFTLKDEFITSKVLDFQNHIKQANSVSIHIRRGDYATNPKIKNHHGLLPISYYRQAIDLITEAIENPHFYIFTDDPVWCRENLKLNDNHTYVAGAGLTYQQELYLMIKCKHNIIANSSFSWWAAWLNQNPNKTVIAPKNWTVKNTEHPNIIADGWITI